MQNNKKNKVLTKFTGKDGVAKVARPEVHSIATGHHYCCCWRVLILVLVLLVIMVAAIVVAVNVLTLDVLAIGHLSGVGLAAHLTAELGRLALLQQLMMMMMVNLLVSADASCVAVVVEEHVCRKEIKLVDF